MLLSRQTIAILCLLLLLGALALLPGGMAALPVEAVVLAAGELVPVFSAATGDEPARAASPKLPFALTSRPPPSLS